MTTITDAEREAALGAMGRAVCVAFCADPDELAPDGLSPEFKAPWVPRWQIEAAGMFYASNDEARKWLRQYL